MVIQIKHYQLKKYLNKTRPYLKDIINNRKKSDKKKIQLTIVIYFISSIDEEHVMYSKRNNIETTINYIVDEVLKQHFKSLQNKYQDNVKQWWKLVSLSSIMFIYYIINATK